MIIDTIMGICYDDWSLY